VSRRGLLGAGAAAGAALGSACAALGGRGPAAKQVAPAALTFATFQLPPNAAGVAVEKAVRAFEGRTPGVTATTEGLTNDQAQDLAKIQTLLAAGTVPDVALSRHHHLGYLASRGAFVAVEPLLQRDRRATRADFFPVVADRLTWGGKLWGLPQDLQVQLSYYNLDLYAAASERPPDGTWTWERWLEASRRLAGAGAFNAPPFFGGVSSLWEIMVWAWGGELLNAAGTECVVNRPPAPEGMQFRADLITKSGIAPTSGDMGGVGEQAFFTNGRLAAFNAANSALMTIDKDARFAWTVQPLPAGRAGPVTLGAGPNYVVFQGSKHQDAAWALISDLVLGEGQTVVLANSTLFPGLRTMARPELLPSYKPEWLTVTMKATERARHPHYNHAGWPDMDRVFRETLAPLWRGERPAQAVTDEAARQITPIVRGEVSSAPR
jgi:ABC-type glycerol-3-phosphate transport system substrate-binding protein